LDDDILGLMGGEDEEAPVAGKRKRGKKASTLADTSDEDEDEDDFDGSDEDEDEDEDTEDEEDEEEDEIPRTRKRKSSKAKAKESESESESVEFNLADYDDGYDDDLMGDAEDRKRLMAMNELDREMELYDRQEKRDELRRQKEIMLSLKAARDEKKEAKMRETRSQTAKKGGKKTTQDKRKNALNALVARRDKKKLARDALDTVLDDDREIEYEEYDDYSDEYDDYYSDEEGYGRSSRRGRGGPAKRKGKRGRRDLEDGELDEDVEASIDEMRDIMLTRNKIVEWINEPFFENVMMDQFLKIGMGTVVNPADGSLLTVYRLAQVLEVVERKPGKYQIFKGDKTSTRSPYEMAAVLKTGKEVLVETNKWVKLRIGSAEATFPMSLVSTKMLESEEFEKYCEECKKARERPPMRSDVRKAQESQKAAEEFRYSAADVWRKIEKGGGRKTLSYAFKKQDLEARLEIAREKGDAEGEAKYKVELEKLEKEHAIRKGQRESRARRMAEINERNVNQNFEAMLERAKEKEKEQKQNRRKSVEKKADPFSRRPTAPLSWAMKKGLGDKKVDDDKSVEKELVIVEEGVEDRERESEGQRAKFPGLEIDFKVDLKLLKKPTQRTKLLLSTMGSSAAKGTKTLSISDYFKRLDSGAM